MTIEQKICKEVVIKMDIVGDVIYGSVTVRAKYARKSDVTKFIWHTGCDIYPRLVNKPYDRTYVEQLKTMIMFYNR